MNEQLATRIRETWATHFGIDVDRLTQPGTSLYLSEARKADNWLLLWYFDGHTVIELSEQQKATIQSLLNELPADTPLRISHLQEKHGDIEPSSGRNYALDVETFDPMPTPSAYTARILTSDDKAAFDAFQSQSSADDRDEGEVGLDHEIAVGIFDDDRIAAVASMYEWRGFSDIGVLVDPAYRRQGLGAAVVSYICETLLAQNHERVIVYRHDTVNVGSKRVALQLNFQHFGDIDVIAPPSAT